MPSIEFFTKKASDNDDLSNSVSPDFIANIDIDKKGLIVELKDYIIPHDYLISEKIEANVSSFSDLIDYWAIDFDHKGDFFNNTFVNYRTPKDRALKLKAGPFSLDRSKIYEILIKIIDIFGNETSKIYKIEN